MHFQLGSFRLRFIAINRSLGANCQMPTLPFRILPAFLFVATCLDVFCQTPTVGSLPKDPVVLMSLGLEKNGLNSADVRPWHIRGSYTLYNKDGKAEDNGVYEEWWVSATKYKRTFTSQHLTQTEYATGAGLFRDGSQDWLGSEIALRSSLIEPLPAITPGEFTFKQHTESEGKSKLTCVSLTYPMRSNLAISSNFLPMYCFEPTVPVLRLSSTGSPFRTIYNQIVLFQGHYLARELSTYTADLKRFDLTVDEIQTMTQMPDSFLDPPANALPVDLTTISFTADYARYGAVQLLKKAVPVYPQAAKDRRIQGTVVIKALIEKDGHVEKMNVTDGPMELRQAALDAAGQWVYRPFIVMGEPRVVEVEIKVIFTMG